MPPQDTRDEDRAAPSLTGDAVLDILPAPVALLDPRGKVTWANREWRKATASLPAGLGHRVGSDYLQACKAGAAPMRHAADGIRSVLLGMAPGFLGEYQLPAGASETWHSVRATAIPTGGALIMLTDITDRKRLARELARLSLEAERRERMLDSMLSSSNDQTFAVDRGARLLWANRSALDAWGISLEEAKGRDALELGISVDKADRIARQVDAVYAHGKPVRDESATTCGQGVVAMYEYILSPVFGPDGRVEFVVGCCRDITAMENSRQALLESIAEFRSLASAMPQIVWSAAADGECYYLNQRWIDYAGMTLADSLGRGWRKALHPDDRDRVERQFQQAMAAQESFSLEVRLFGAEGQCRWWLLRGVPVRQDDRLVRWIGTCTDVDELKAAEHAITVANSALRQQGNELRALLDGVPAMVWQKDRYGRVVQINHRAASFSGLSVDQARGRPMEQLFPRKAAEYAAEDRQIFASGQPLLGKVEQIQGVEGKSLWVQSDKVPFHGPDGGIAGVMVMKHDISERKQAQDALRELNADLELRVRDRTAELAVARDAAERANRAKSSFLATMSHEIRTPMTGLLGLLELLDLSRLDHEQRSTLQVARDSGQTLKEIIDGILDFSKIEANSLELAPRPASLRQVIEGIGRLHASVAAARNVRLSTVVDPQVGKLLCFDPLRLGQILNNFVSNAVKFTEAGSITVHAEMLRREGGKEHLRMVVRDTGIGIPPERIGRLFSPFTQADADTAARFGGTGLGLFIANRLAGLMQGTVAISSQPGVGTTLTLSLAFDVCDEGAVADDVDANRRLGDLVAARPGPPTIERAVQDGTLLLVVDDHPTNRMVLLRQVRLLGYAAESVADGAAALLAWQSGRFAAIITDCNMPRLNGFELARAIRGRELQQGLRRIPIIGCTANAMAEAAIECRAAGMDDSITKPVSLQDICGQLERWVPLPAAHGRFGPQPPVAPAPDDADVADVADVVDVAGAARLLDMGLLRTVTGDDAQMRARVLADFRRCNEEDAGELRLAVQRGDFAQVAHSAHRVRGACAMLGATLLAQASALVQEAGAARDAAQLGAAMREFELQLLRLGAHLATLR